MPYNVELLDFFVAQHKTTPVKAKKKRNLSYSSTQHRTENFVNSFHSMRQNFEFPRLLKNRIIKKMKT